MIELIIAERCTACDRCVEICPSNVFSRRKPARDRKARDDCQTASCAELCAADALYVGPNADHPEPVST